MHETTTFAEDLGREHASLFHQVEELERIVVTDRPPAPAAVLVHALCHVRAVLHRHFLFEELGGYMSHVLDHAPHLHRRIEQLLADHHDLSQDLEELLGALQIEPNTNPVATNTRAEVQRWLHQLRSHEARENQLVVEACGDLGEED